MAKIKYTKMGETPSSYECTKRQCKWQGKGEEKSKKREEGGWMVDICPKCGNEEFFGLI